VSKPAKRDFLRHAVRAIKDTDAVLFRDVLAPSPLELPSVVEAGPAVGLSQKPSSLCLVFPFRTARRCSVKPTPPLTVPCEQ